MEGISKPIVFTENGYKISDTNVPIDEVALIMKKLLRGVMDIIMILLLVFNIILSLVIAAQVFNISGG